MRNHSVAGIEPLTGVSDQAGSVPRFGEAVDSVPVTVSVLRMARQVLGMLDGEPVEKVTYELSGKLSGASFFGTQRCTSKGEIALPQRAPAAVTAR